MLHARLAPFLSAFTLSEPMPSIVSGVTTFRVRGSPPDLPELWLEAWPASWLLAFPAVLVVAPVTRRFVDRLVRSRGEPT